VLFETNEIKNMPIPQKLALLELISQALFDESDNVESPVWHKAILEGREAEYKNEFARLSLEDAKLGLKE